MPDDAPIDATEAAAAKRYARRARTAGHAAGARADPLLADGGAVSADAGDDRRIHLVEEGDLWVARDPDEGVASQGATRQEALANLDEALALHRGEIGESIDSPEEEHAALEEMGLDPDEVMEAREENELPDFMR